jgi:hypothetical protein
VIAVGIWLLSVGLADLVAGLSGEPKAGARTFGAVATGFATPLVLCLLLGTSVGSLILVALLTGLTSGVWIALRRDPQRMSAVRALAALLFLLASFAGVSALGVEAVSPDALLLRGLRQLPFPLVAGATSNRALFVGGVLLMLFATSNAIVRLVLTAMGTRFSNAEQRLRGGRVIGPLERVLIFGLGLAGEATAAALVIGAKGLLRYPELNGLRGESGAAGPSARTIDVVTEYLLIGSLTSWLLALFPLVLVPA